MTAGPAVDEVGYIREELSSGNSPQIRMTMIRIKDSARLALALTMLWGAARATAEPAASPASAQAEATPAAQAAPAPADSAVAKPETHGGLRGRRPAQRSPDAVLDERVAALGNVLDLDAAQKDQVRKILVVQRDQLRHVWSDPARQSADRIGATQSINERTEDRIRSILNEEQRGKYIAPKPAGTTDERPDHSLDYWMGQMRGTH